MNSSISGPLGYVISSGSVCLRLRSDPKVTEPHFRIPLMGMCVPVAYQKYLTQM